MIIKTIKRILRFPLFALFLIVGTPLIWIFCGSGDISGFYRDALDFLLEGS